MSAAADARLLPPGVDYAGLVGGVADPLLRRGAGRGWWWALLAALPIALLVPVCLAVLFIEGVGVWGNNSTIVWGFDIANYVWWIGIGNAGTLISSMLLLTRQGWRASINRFAEAMTLFAAAIAGLFPLIHLGRPWFFYWLAPYPNTMRLWPQWRGPLVWDFWAILGYIIFSALFWYLGLIPDLATLRDRATGRWTPRIYGALALGWRGSAAHWARHDALYRTMAAMAVPLVVSVHSVVGMDFAFSVMPGWRESIFPPYFVVGAMFSGFAMVILLAAAIRWGMNLRALITDAHFDAMAKILLTGSIIMTLSYATEWFTAWYGGEHAERTLVGYLFAGTYAPLYWLQLLGNCGLTQLLWFRRVRRSIPTLCVIAVGVQVGMWLERVLIIWDTLGHAHLPSMFRAFVPTVWDWLLLAGTLGLFATLFLLFVRLVPVISMHEVSQLRDRTP